MSQLNVLNIPKVRKPVIPIIPVINRKTAKEIRLSKPPKKPSAKFKLTKKEIQVVHVATVHLNIWLLDAIDDYPEVEELYNSIKAVSWSFYNTWDEEVNYAQSNLNKLAGKLPSQIKSFTIPAGSLTTEFSDIDSNIDSISDISLKLIECIKKEKSVMFKRQKSISSDTVFTAKVKWVEPSINPLTFGLSLIFILAESKNIDIKLRNKWLKLANKIYSEVEAEIGLTNYSLKNSAILASLYTDKMYMDYTNNGVLISYNS